MYMKKNHNKNILAFYENDQASNCNNNAKSHLFNKWLIEEIILQFFLEWFFKHLSNIEIITCYITLYIHTSDINFIQNRHKSTFQE